MNKRIRQWMRAEKRMDKHDSPVIARIKNNSIDSFSMCVVFRRSEKQAMIEKYGSTLDMMIDIRAINKPSYRT